jgi:beta-glucosidase
VNPNRRRDQRGQPRAITWLERVSAVLQLWYPGQEFGHALADVLSGAVDPSGRLPTTVPKCLEDTPSFPYYPGANGVVEYGEGLFLGYRHYDRAGIEPAFPFGFGLSYTRFTIEALEVDRTRLGANDSVRVRARVTNVGSRPGQTVAQLYLADLATAAPVAPRQLRGFEKVTLAPGESTMVEFNLAPHDFAHFEVERSAWVVTPGRYRIEVGQSSRDLSASIDVQVGS